MTSEQNRTQQPFSFKRFIEDEAERLRKALRELGPNDTEEAIQCIPCSGTGLLMATIKYSKLDSFSTFFKTLGGVDITSQKLVSCPCCCGTGVDLDRFDSAVALLEKLKKVA